MMRGHGRIIRYLVAARAIGRQYAASKAAGRAQAARPGGRSRGITVNCVARASRFGP